MAFLSLSVARSQLDAALHRRAQNVVAAFEHHAQGEYQANCVKPVSAMAQSRSLWVWRDGRRYSIPMLLLFFDVTMLLPL
ncbi:MAG TPA: hypothetical protein VH595_24110 [Verrucomicrobiae bacterium]|jgi:hypothetical protein|nr:hypothetical protein [Verrucomicrobiae bacterium]